MLLEFVTCSTIQQLQMVTNNLTFLFLVFIICNDNEGIHTMGLLQRQFAMINVFEIHSCTLFYLPIHFSSSQMDICLLKLPHSLGTGPSLFTTFHDLFRCSFLPFYQHNWLDLTCFDVSYLLGYIEEPGNIQQMHT